MLSSDLHCKENDRTNGVALLHQGDSQVGTIWKIQTAFGDDAMSITQIKDKNYVKKKERERHLSGC